MKPSSSKRSTRAAKQPGNAETMKNRIKSLARRREFWEPWDDQERDIRDAIEAGTLKPVADEERRRRRS